MTRQAPRGYQIRNKKPRHLLRPKPPAQYSTGRRFHCILQCRAPRTFGELSRYPAMTDNTSSRPPRLLTPEERQAKVAKRRADATMATRTLRTIVSAKGRNKSIVSLTAVRAPLSADIRLARKPKPQLGWKMIVPGEMELLS